MKACTFCMKDVDTDDEENFVEVASWVNGPKLDGPKLRIQTGRVAHKSCVDNVVHGQAPDQPDLFHEEPKVKLKPVIEYCEEQTKSGMCNTVLDEAGRCPKWRRHLEG